MRLQLLHAERNALLVSFDLDDFRFNLLSCREHIRWLIDAMPGNFGDMQQSIDTPDVNEGAVIGKASDRAVHDIAFFQFGVTTPLRNERFFFSKSASIDNDVFFGDVKL